MVVVALVGGAVACFELFKPKRTPALPPVENPGSGGVVETSASPSGSKNWHFIDLSGFTNADLSSNAIYQPYDMRSFHPGKGTYGGTTFRVDGLVQLGSAAAPKEARKYPNSVEGIPINLKSPKLYFLHSTGWTMKDGAQIASYIVHFEDGRKEEIPVIYGKDVRNYVFFPPQSGAPDPENSGEGTAWKQGHRRLYMTTWSNPDPKAQITTVDYVSAGTGCAPFLVAITAE